MRELRHDPDLLRDVLRRRLLRAAVSAAGQLDRAARGGDVFANDYQLRACLALARLSPALVGELDDNSDTTSDPQWSTPEKTQFFEDLSSLRSEPLDIEQWARWWLRCFRDHGPQEGRFKNAAEAMEYGRQRCRAKIAERSARAGDLESDEKFNNRILNEGK